jgi:large subunit ribosomal protein L10
LNREQKEKEIAVLKDMFSRSRHVAVTDHTGINVNDLTQLRGRLRGLGSELRVAKNTLLRLAVKGTDLEGLGDHFHGPTSVIFGFNDSMETARIINQSIKETEKPAFKSYYFEGQILGYEGLKRIAELPPREHVIATLISVVEAPLRKFIGLLDAAAVEFVGTLDALAESRKN